MISEKARAMAGLDNYMDEDGDYVTWFDLRYQMCTLFRSESVQLCIHYHFQCRPNDYLLTVISQSMDQWPTQTTYMTLHRSLHFSFQGENSLNLRSIRSSLGEPSHHSETCLMTVGNRPLNLPTLDTYVRGCHLAPKSGVWNDGSQKTISVLFIRYSMTIASSSSSMAIELCSFSDRFDLRKGLFIPESYSCRLEFRGEYHIHLKLPHQMRASYVRMLLITSTSYLTSLRDDTFRFPPWYHSHVAMALITQPAMRGQQRC
jgi:hypothetical protein